VHLEFKSFSVAQGLRIRIVTFVMAQSKIKLDSLAYVHYCHRDLALEEKFLSDFGLERVCQSDSRIYYRGTGPQPFIYVAEQSPGESLEKRFVAGAWLVQSEDDLERASHLPGASKIENARDPGHGKIVTVNDPNGFEIRLLFGQALLDENPKEPTAVNTPFQKGRKGEFVRVQQRPSLVHKLGHYGFMVPPQDFKMTLSWYTSTFNLKVTDSVYDPDTNEDKTCFLHVDKEKTYTDHHVGIIQIQVLGCHVLTYRVRSLFSLAKRVD
jgi:4-hydroxyphenylpyruvate dioxygenase-like putative hemolysin